MKGLGFMKRGLQFVNKHADLFLTIGAVAGTVATAYFASKDTLEAEKALQAKAEEEGKEVKDLDTETKIKVAAPHYKRTLVMALGTIGSEAAAFKVSSKKLKDAVTVYEGLKLSHKVLKQSVDENTTEAKRAKIYKDAADKKIEHYSKTINTQKFVETGHGDLPFIFAYTQTPFHCSYEWLQHVEEILNTKAKENGTDISIADIAEEIGLPYYETWSEMLGFLNQGDWSGDILRFDTTVTTKLPDGTPVTVVNFWDVPSMIREG